MLSSRQEGTVARSRKVAAGCGEAAGFRLCLEGGDRQQDLRMNSKRNVAEDSDTQRLVVWSSVRLECLLADTGRARFGAGGDQEHGTEHVLLCMLVAHLLHSDGRGCLLPPPCLLTPYHISACKPAPPPLHVPISTSPSLWALSCWSLLFPHAREARNKQEFISP